MSRAIVCLLLLSGTVLAQSPNFKKDAGDLQFAVNQVIDSTVPGMGLLSKAKATYLEGYGMVITLEASLEPPRNPFSSPKSPTEVRKIVAERRTIIEQKLIDLMKKRVPSLESVAATETVAIVLHLYNSNPADLPNMASQLVFTAKKQDASNVLVKELQ